MPRFETRIESGKESVSDTIAAETVDVEVPDPASGTPLTFRIASGTAVPDHLLEAYKKATGKARKAPAKDKAQ